MASQTDGHRSARRGTCAEWWLSFCEAGHLRRTVAIFVRRTVAIFVRRTVAIFVRRTVAIFVRGTVAIFVRRTMARFLRDGAPAQDDGHQSARRGTCAERWPPFCETGLVRRSLSGGEWLFHLVPMVAHYSDRCAAGSSRCSATPSHREKGLVAGWTTASQCRRLFPTTRVLRMAPKPHNRCACCIQLPPPLTCLYVIDLVPHLGHSQHLGR
jgi:hypothetical protein